MNLFFCIKKYHSLLSKHTREMHHINNKDDSWITFKSPPITNSVSWSPRGIHWPYHWDNIKVVCTLLQFTSGLQGLEQDEEINQWNKDHTIEHSQFKLFAQKHKINVQTSYLLWHWLTSSDLFHNAKRFHASSRNIPKHDSFKIYWLCNVSVCHFVWLNIIL